MLPSGEAIIAVPTTLVAICLNNKGLERVKDSGALECFVPIFTTPMYLRALQVIASWDLHAEEMSCAFRTDRGTFNTINSAGSAGLHATNFHLEKGS